jgi:hypothetical protein
MGEITQTLEVIQTGRTDSPAKVNTQRVLGNFIQSSVETSGVGEISPDGQPKSDAYQWNLKDVIDLDMWRQYCQNDEGKEGDRTYGDSHVEAMEKIFETYADISRIVLCGVADEVLPQRDNEAFAVPVVGVEIDPNKVARINQALDYKKCDPGAVHIVQGDLTKAISIDQVEGRTVYDVTLLLQHLSLPEVGNVLKTIIDNAKQGDILHVSDALLARWGAELAQGGSMQSQEAVDFINKIYVPMMAKVGWEVRGANFWKDGELDNTVAQVGADRLRMVDAYVDDKDSKVSTLDTTYSWMMATIATTLMIAVKRSDNPSLIERVQQLGREYIKTFKDKDIIHQMPPLTHSIWEVVKQTS